MGALRDPRGGQTHVLSSRVIVGRTAAATLELADPRVSREHAVVWWDGNGWFVRDLGSRNGTFVDGTRLDKGAFAPLKAGGQVGFGRVEPTWEVVDTGPPGAFAMHPSGAIVHALDGFLCLPDEEDPEVVVYQGADGGWHADRDGVTTPARKEIVAGGVLFRLELPRLHRATLDAASGIDAGVVGLRFHVSQDEEHVQVQVRLPQGWTPLEPRAHHYLLLTLARLRLEQAELAAAEQGWIHVDELTRMLRIRRGLLNMQILRVRREMEAVGILNAAGIVERRPLSGTLRLATATVTVTAL